MFSAGHLIWIALCALLIGGGVAACLRLRPALDRVLTIGLVLALISEAVKFFSVIQVLPVVVPVVSGAEVRPIRPPGTSPPICAQTTSPLSCAPSRSSSCWPSG